MGMTEIFFILLLALIVIGPKKLPGLARTLGRGLAEFRKTTDEIQRSIYQEVHKPLDPKEFLKDLETKGAQTRPGPPPETPSPSSDTAKTSGGEGEHPERNG